MDTVSEADYIASLLQDPDDLEEYIKLLSKTATGFSEDWRKWPTSYPKFEEFYNSRNKSATSFDLQDKTYDQLRPIATTNSLGAVITREITKMAFGSSSNQETLNRTAARVVQDAKFNAAPFPALVMYAVLRSVSGKPDLDSIMCNEAKLQGLLESDQGAGSSQGAGGYPYPTYSLFSAGKAMSRKLLLRCS